MFNNLFSGIPFKNRAELFYKTYILGDADDPKDGEGAEEEGADLEAVAAAETAAAEADVAAAEAEADDTAEGFCKLSNDFRVAPPVSTPNENIVKTPARS